MITPTAKYRVCRRLGEGVYAKCQSTKYAIGETKKKTNAMKTRGRRKNITEFGKQLMEKQRVRVTYGVTERQMVNYVRDAKKLQGGTPAEEVFRRLELRLDNVAYRLGFLSSRQAARQATSHGHFMVNGRRVTIPSYKLSVGDVVSIRPQSKSKPIFAKLAAGEKVEIENTPNWIAFDPSKGEAKIKSLPKVGEYDTHLNYKTLIEFYSRV